MTKIALLRCRKNEEACPLTNCIKTLLGRKQAFAGYEATELTGVFTLPESDEKAVALARVLKAKGAEAIHVVTCAFAHKEKDGWHLGRGFEEGRDELYAEIARETGLPVIKGAAHLPAGYVPERFEP